MALNIEKQNAKKVVFYYTRRGKRITKNIKRMTFQMKISICTQQQQPPIFCPFYRSVLFNRWQATHFTGNFSVAVFGYRINNIKSRTKTKIYSGKIKTYLLFLNF